METYFLAKTSAGGPERLISDSTLPGGMQAAGSQVAGMFNLAWQDGTVVVKREVLVPEGKDQFGNTVPEHMEDQDVEVPNWRGGYCIKNTMPFPFAIVQVNSSPALLNDLITRLDAMGLAAPAQWIGKAKVDDTNNITKVMNAARLTQIKNWFAQFLNAAQKSKFQAAMDSANTKADKARAAADVLLDAMGMTWDQL